MIEPPDSALVFDTSRAGDAAGLRFARQLCQGPHRHPVVFAPEHGSESMAVAALRAGVDDYLEPRAGVQEVRDCLLRLRSAPAGPGVPAKAPPGPRRPAPPAGGRWMVGQSQAIRALEALVPRVAASGTQVLIEGETGTGKERLARWIHEAGSAVGSPFVAVNAAALPVGLLESELFGYERGAFTGATSSQLGAFERADGGTLFLDEVGEMSPSAQAKILRALESHRIRRVGGSREIPLRLRVISATNRILSRAVEEGRFRPDLYYRLNVIHIVIPPLRERPEDLEDLVEHLLTRLARGGDVRRMHPAALALLRTHAWPGNVRELRNAIEHALVTAGGRWIGVEDLPAHLHDALDWRRPAVGDERERILSTLRATRWNKSRAAELLKCSRMTLYRKLRKHQITT